MRHLFALGVMMGKLEFKTRSARGVLVVRLIRLGENVHAICASIVQCLDKLKSLVRVGLVITCERRR